MSVATRVLQRVRAVADGLGPLRWVVLATVVVPTIGLLVVLAHLRELSAVPPGEPWLAFVAAVAAIAVTTGAVLLPPGIAALTAGWCLGPWNGGAAAALGTGLGALVGQRLVWPAVGARLYPFMRPRLRFRTVQRFVAGSSVAQAMRVAVLRLGAPFPFAVVNLLLAAAAVPARAVLAGSVIGMVPVALLAAAVGAMWRRWRDVGEPPAAVAIAVFAVGVAATALAMFTARRTWRRAASSG